MTSKNVQIYNINLIKHNQKSRTGLTSFRSNYKIELAI